MRFLDRGYCTCLFEDDFRVFKIVFDVSKKGFHVSVDLTYVIPFSSFLFVHQCSL